MSEFWSGWVILFTVANIIGIWWLLWVTARPVEGKEDDTTGHSWDGITEYNKPLPRWWLWMFYLSIVFAVFYLVLYPGLGNYKGTLGWNQIASYEQEIDAADTKFGELFAGFAGVQLEKLAQNSDAIRVGQRLYLTSCAQCHGSDARGVPGYPNLADDDWLYGGSPEAIKESILNGRSGTMPALTALGPRDTTQIIAYVRQLNQYRVDEGEAAIGQRKFATHCAVCHGPDATGNTQLGAPNLTNNIWLHGGTEYDLYQTITQGRQGFMPAHDTILGEEKVHLIAAYVYSLSADFTAEN